MKAIVQRRYGFPEDVLRVREVPEPAVGDADAAVEVSFSSIAGDDWHLMKRPAVRSAVRHWAACAEEPRSRT